MPNWSIINTKIFSIKFFINSNVITDEYEMLVVPFIFNKDFTKVKDFLHNNILPLSENPLDEKEALMVANTRLCLRYDRYSKDNKNIHDAISIMDYAMGLNIKCKELRILKAKPYKNIYSESEIIKMSKLISNILYKWDVIQSDVKATMCEHKKISQDSKEF